MIWLVLLLILLALGGGGIFQSRYGPYAFSPVAIILIIVVVLYLTGALR